MHSFKNGFAALAMLLSSIALAEDAANSAAGIGGDSDGRFYAGLGAATLEYEGRHDGLAFDGTSIGVGAFGGFRLSDNLSLELTYQSHRDAVDMNDIPGSGIRRLDINSGWDTASVKAVGDLSLQELLSWRRDWRLFGTLGYYRSDIDRTVVTLGTGASETVRDDESGLLLGTGVLYKLGFIDLRGYVEWYGVLDDREAWDAGVAVQMRF
jgi:hypothetical protein